MPFRTLNNLHELITGSPEEVAMAICFYSSEDDDKRDARDWMTQVLPGLRTKLGLPRNATWQDICRVNNQQLARELGLPENTEFYEIVVADNRRLAELMGIDPSTPYHLLYRHAVSLCAVHLGLPADSSWQDVYRAYKSAAVS